MSDTLKSLVMVAAAAVFTLAPAVGAEPLPDEVREAVRQLKHYDYGPSRKPLAVIEQFVPKAAGHPQQRAELAALPGP